MIAVCPATIVLILVKLVTAFENEEFGYETGPRYKEEDSVEGVVIEPPLSDEGSENKEKRWLTMEEESEVDLVEEEAKRQYNRILKSSGSSNGLAFCKKTKDVMQYTLISPLYPELSNGGTCNEFLSHFFPRSSVIKFDEVKLSKGDYITFQDVLGKLRFEGPMSHIKPFGLFWPMRIEFNTTERGTSSKFSLTMTDALFDPPCNKVIHVEEQNHTVRNPSDDDTGRIPQGIFCEIRLTVEPGHYINLMFTYLRLGQGETIQLQSNGPELRLADGTYKFTHQSKNNGAHFYSTDNVMSLYVVTQSNSLRGEFEFVASRKVFD